MLMNICTELVQCTSDAGEKQPPQYHRPKIGMILNSMKEERLTEKKKLILAR